MSERKTSIDKIIYAFAILENKIKLSNSLNLLDINIHVENFFRDILNYLYLDRKFTNLNIDFSNYSAIDLGDNICDLSFQITSDSSRSKVLETIEKYNRRKDYKEVIMLFCVIKKPKRRKNISENTIGFQLSEWDFSDLVKKINDLEGKKLEEVSDFIYNEIIFKERKSDIQIVDFPFSYFISSIEKDELYIPRKLANYRDIPKETKTFIENNENQSFDLSALVSKKSKIAVLGNAGIGKTLELKESAISISNKGDYYPILIPLNIFNPKNNIVDYLPKEWKCIPENKTILLLDGLDEIEPSHFNEAKKEIALFSLNYPEIRLVVSCRTNFYDLPSDNEVGTLRDFEPYYIQDLTHTDVINYVTNNHGLNGNDFINSVYNNNFSDLVINPFFLKLLIQNYKTNNSKLSRNRVEIFREFINSRLKLDEVHFSETINIKDEKFKALKLLKRISLVMEVVGIRVIDEKDMREFITETQDFKLIAYCTVFKKEEGSSDKWKFEHNYFQEFLCAELLSTQYFEIVKSLICYTDYEKVLPNWFNTVAQLISILDVHDELFKKLTAWLIKNDAEVLVNVEREKLSPEIREDIFKQIFNYYKDLKIWIDSNKFNNNDLAYFGQTDKSLKFVLDEACEKENHRIVRLNALQVLGGFNLEQYWDKNNVKKALIELIKEKKADTYFTFNIVHTIDNCKFHDKDTIEEIYQLLGQEKSQFIRASMYKLLYSSDEFEKYVEYFIEGFGLLNKKIPGRDDTNLADEGWHLREGIKKFKTFQSLAKIIDFYIKNPEIERDIVANELLESLVSNSIIAYSENSEIYHFVFELMKSHAHSYHHKEPDIILRFFIDTKTKNKLLEDVLIETNNNDDNYVYRRLISLLIDDANYNRVIDSFSGGTKNIQIIEGIFWTLKQMNQPLAGDFASAIQKKTGHIIEIPEQIDWEALRQKQAQKSIDLLFNYSEFQNECIRVFEGKDEISWDDLWNYKKIENKNIEPDDIYVESALNLVRDFARNKVAKKTEVYNWIQKRENFELFMIDKAIQYIKGNDKLEINGQQISILKDWYDRYINEIDFTKAITNKSGDTFSINNYARYLTFLLKKFDFKCKEDVLLDMFSFAFGNIMGMDTIEFEYILKNVDENKAQKRIIENINRHKIFEFSIYENHFIYAFKNKLADSYSAVIEDIISSDFKSYQKNKIIDSYFDSGNNVDKIKDIFDKLHIEQKLQVIQRLISIGDNEYSKEKLLKMHDVETDEDYLCSINNALIKLKEILGLEYSIDWIKKYRKNPFSQHGQGLAYYENIEALPYQLILLELSYDKSISSEQALAGLWSMVINGIEHLALSSKENYQIVTAKLKVFINENKGKLEDVEIINRPIEMIKEKFYKNEAIKYDFATAKNKIDQLVKNF
jgi:hypothetical protein